MADKETVIGPDTRISGEIRGEEDLVVRGRVDGKVSLSETLTVDTGGIVQADVEVKALVVSGVLVGNIVASQSVRLTDKARVVGDVTAPRFVMEAGAAYRGGVEMGAGAEARSKSRSAGAERPRSAPPRLAPPRPATTTVRAPAPAAPPRVVSIPARPAPALPSPSAAASAASAP